MSAIGLHRLGLMVAAFVLQTALLRAGLPGPDEAQARPSLVGSPLPGWATRASSARSF
jgi:hypothetical protein